MIRRIGIIDEKEMNGDTGVKEFLLFVCSDYYPHFSNEIIFKASKLKKEKKWDIFLFNNAEV